MKPALYSLAVSPLSIRTFCPKTLLKSWDKLDLRFKTECLRVLSMTEFTSFREIIKLWASHEAMAAEIGAGCTAGQVSKWWQRHRIPGDWWAAVVLTPTAKTAGVTADLMMRLAARPRPAADLAGACA